MIFVEFPEIGANLDIGSSFGEIEAVKTVSDLFAPISGNIISINDEIEDTPDLVNTDPYGEGWLIKMSQQKMNKKKNSWTPMSIKNLLVECLFFKNY